MRLNIDFAPNRRRSSARSLVLLTGALLALAGAVWTTFAVFEQTQQLRHVPIASTHRSPARIALPPAKAEAINRAIRQLNLPWETLFAEIETRLNNRIALLALEPDAANHLVRIHGEAKSADDMVDFVSALGEPGFFRGATLVRHEINEADRNRPIRFVAEAQWRPD